MRESQARTMPPARGTKTLGWFMNGVFEKEQVHQMTPQQQQPHMLRRQSSSDDSKHSAALPDLFQNQQQSQQQQQQQKKKHVKKRKTLSQYGAARKDGYAASQAMSESSEEGGTVVQPTPPSVTTSGTSSGSATTTTTTTTTTQQANDEYWFYDVATDGYYYEQNGAKGWRRRQPNAAVHKGGKDQEVAHMNVNGPSKYNQLLAAQAAAAHAAFMQQAFQIQAQQAAAAAATSPVGQPPAQPTMRYYDPNSDGFFYEMASVDGWKRRQPNKPASASVPAGITRPYAQRQDHQLQMMQAAAAALIGGAPQGSPIGASSYGAALARGQLPRNTVQQAGAEKLPPLSSGPESRDSAASSQCGDTFAELFGSSDPVFNPVQRPSSLKLEQKAVSPQIENTAITTLFDADKFLGDYPELSMKQVPSSQSPMKESWNSFRSCSLFSPIKPSKRVLAPAPVASNHNHQSMTTPLIDEMDDTMVMLLKDLDKLWANTPVSGLNQA